MPPLKVKFFVWLATQDRLWTVDRLAKRGWSSCGLCPLCKREQESRMHPFFNCLFTKLLGNLANDWLHLENINTDDWHLEASVKEWWTKRSDSSNANREAMASLTMLVCWTVWNERNAWVFRNKSVLPTILLNFIKEEARLWVTAGPKRLGRILPGE